MTRCEACGAQFEMPQSDVITSSKVLCPSCAAERRAMLRAARSAAAGGAGAMATTGAAAVPAAAAAPAAPQRAAPPAVPATPLRAAPLAAPATPQRAAPRPDRGAAAAHPPEHHVDARQLREQAARRTARRGWIVVGGLGLVTGLVLVFVTSKQHERSDAIAAFEQSLDDFRNGLMRVDLGNEEQLKEAKERVAKERKLWHGTRIEADVTAQLSRINSSLQTIIKTRSLVEKLNGVESRLQASPSLATLGELFATVRDVDLKQQAADAGGALLTRLADDQRRVRTLYVESLRQAAAAAAQATTGADLAPFGVLEDTLRTVIEEAQMANDVDTATSTGALYKETYRQINGIVARLFDQQYQNRAPWTDLLAGPGDWAAVPSSSFEFRFGAGGLVMTNGSGEGAASGGLSYTPGTGWRDYVVDLEFQLDSGTLVFYTRVGEKMDSKMVPAFTAGTKNPNVLVEYGKACAITVSTIGNQLTVFRDGSPVYTDDITAGKSRKGQPGIVVQAGTKLTVSRLRARHLR
jgi:hypothetical protein